ncbi:cobalt transporter CbiM [Stecheria sp. CLA-KB-P133]|uniref:Cobalt transporter CbiM n=1 Tax=Grylomicrobium aquisgranensis TaxID=2926318 RepID=A0AB35U3B0_9FIRM|nr:cobalt transporter CbiM [Stecheria sp. CLA-KB-P133]
MHIPENYLSPATCAVMGAAMVPVWVHAVRRVNRDLPKEKMPLLGVGASFSFLSMMFNVPLPGGTTGHAVGGTLIAILFGPDAACIAISIALLLQAVIFGDGGILSFGANCFNMAFVLPYAGYGIYSLIQKASGKKDRHGISYAAAAIGSYAGINLAALCTAIEFGIQPILFHDAAGNALYCPYDFSVSIPAMMIPHLLVAGIVEAAFTIAILAFVRKTSPDLLYGDDTKTHTKSRVPLFALTAILIAASPLGLLAQGTAWGEWGADEISAIVTNGKTLGYTPQGLSKGWTLQALLPDYAVSGFNEIIGYILSAIIGTALLIIFFKLLSIPVKKKEKYAA